MAASARIRFLSAVILSLSLLLPTAATSPQAGEFSLLEDTYIHADGGTHGGGSQVYVKRDWTDTSAGHRKGYLQYDYATGTGRLLADAWIEFPFYATGLGALDATGESTVFDFHVYGISNESIDTWDEATTDWNNAPANDTSNGYGVISADTTDLGTFSVTGAGVGTHMIQTPALQSFLQADTDGKVSFIVVRETLPPAGNNNYVHGFRSKESSTGVKARLFTTETTVRAQDRFFVGAGDYTAGASIVGQDSSAAVGFTGTWSSSTTSIIMPNAETLHYADGSDVIGQLDTAGGSVQIDLTPYNDTFRQADHSLAAYNTASTYYLSGLLSAPADTDGKAKIRWYGSGTDLSVGFEGQQAVMYAGGTSVPIPLTQFTPDQPMFFVAKVDVDANGSNDQVSVWVNPTQYSSEAVAGPAKLVTSAYDVWNNAQSATALQVSTRNYGGAGPVKFDEVNLGTSWNEVVALANPDEGHMGYQQRVLPTTAYNMMGQEARELAGTSGTDPQIRVGKSDAGVGVMRPLMGFELEDVPEGNWVKEITLRMTIDSWSSSTAEVGNLELHAILPGPNGETMIEGEAGWSTRQTGVPWTTPGGDFDSTVLSTIPDVTADEFAPGTTLVFPSTPEFVAAANEALAAGLPLELIMLAPEIEAGAPNAFIRFRSDDYGAGLQDWMTRPLLSISFAVPEPSSAIMGLIGLLLMAGFRARRRWA